MRRFTVNTAVHVWLGATLAALGATMACGAGAAAAAEPVPAPDQARLGVRLNQAECAALAAGPVPALITLTVPPYRMGAGLKDDSRIYRDEHDRVHATLRQVVLEASEHPDGSITFYLNAPGTHDGRLLDVYQDWG